MCGIIGYIGDKNAVDIILEGLKRLEYRGYDSAGISYINGSGSIETVRCEGKINELLNKICFININSKIAIGHTRWATHGSPTEKNAHPHRSDNITIVHNGIIENYITIKKELIELGFTFNSDTDTEVVCHLIQHYAAQGSSFKDAVLKTIGKIKGSYALAIMNEKEPDKIICARKDSPLVIGLGDREYYVASDVPAFLNYTKDVIFLDDNEIGILTKDGVEFLNNKGETIEKTPTIITWNASMAEKGGYKHFMLKEIFEQPRAIADTLTGRINPDRGQINLYEFGIINEDSFAENIKKIFISGCGTSWHAALCGKYMIEDLARIPVEVDIASEFRYRNPLISKDDLFISITQSGETADTLGALRKAKSQGAKTLTICNALGSTASRESDYVFYTHSGPEIGVASTKAFTTQILSLYLLAISLHYMKYNENSKTAELIKDLLHLPSLVEEVLINAPKIQELAKIISKTHNFLFLGRGILYPIALEGALKLKEISYIHAEGYPAAEMKHGPIALIDENMPVVILLLEDYLYDKVLSNIEEVRSRGGKTIVFSNTEDGHVIDRSDYFFQIPKANVNLSSILMTIPLQLLAYHVAVLRGCDVDQPRNLAKSVTVE
ncbi:glucosamine--fructose-6-phosphate aminotransferase [Candidatus Magnetoovum chiemensis]|nr:glucosamine--fructose-6-phosphate aminotransferase [Candidatus Magnetoovum chiemensis]